MICQTFQLKFLRRPNKKAIELDRFHRKTYNFIMIFGIFSEKKRVS